MATILNLQTTVSTPKVNYKIDAVTSNRTIDGITIKFTITSSLSSSGSSLGSGSTYGIVGYIKVLGTEYSFTIKGTSDKWSGTTAHTVSRTIPFTGIEPTATSITGITFRTTRTGDKDDGKIEHAGELASTKCSDITFEAAHTPPTDVIYTMIETNQKLIDAGVANNVFVKGLSIKSFDISGTLHDDAIIKKYAIYNRLNVFSTTTLPVIVDLTQNELQTDMTYVTQIPIFAQLVDTFETAGYSTTDLYNYIEYNKIKLVEISTTAKRNGQTSGKVKLNVQGNLFNGVIGKVDQTAYKPTIKYKFWKLNDPEPTTYDYEVYSDNVDIEDGKFNVSEFEIGSSDEKAVNYFNPEFAYRVKVYVEDNFSSSESLEKPIPVGEATWTEYKDRVDFKKVTIKGNEVSYGDTGWQPFSWTNSAYVGTTQSAYTLNKWRVKDGILYVMVGAGKTSTINTTSEDEIARIPITNNASYENDRVWIGAVGGSGSVAGFSLKQNADYISINIKPHSSSAFPSAPWFSTFFAVPLDETAVINI